MRLNNNVSIATPEMDDINMSAHCSLVTVHAGKNLAKFAALTDNGTLCVRCISSTYVNSDSEHVSKDREKDYRPSTTTGPKSRSRSNNGKIPIYREPE